MEFDILIPARYSSSRLPGKPLLDIAGKPLIQWAYESARASAAGRVVVATDDERISDTVRAFGGEVCMTRPDHVSGSDRIAEASEKLGLAEDSIVVNVQGDEPSLPGDLIDRVAGLLEDDPGLQVATACHPILDKKEFEDPNVVKVALNRSGQALYFSRAPIPFCASVETGERYGLRHLGIYAFRVGFLRRYSTLRVTPLESAERLEQLRILENGVPIALCLVEQFPGPGIDTLSDLERFREEVKTRG